MPVIGDVDSDGSADVVVARSGVVEAHRQDGSLLWSSKLFPALKAIVAIDDIDGIPGQDVLIVSTYRLFLLDGATGAKKWSTPRSMFVNGAVLDAHYVKVSELTDSPGKEIVVFPDHTETRSDAVGQFIRGVDGLSYKRVIVPQIDGGQLNFPQIAIADIDNDGSAKEVVVIARGRLQVYNGQGELRGETRWQSGSDSGYRHYGYLTLAQMDDDQPLEAVVVADSNIEAISVLDLLPAPRLISDKFFDFANQNPRLSMRGLAGSVADLDGDGKAEIAVNVWDGNAMRIEIYGKDLAWPRYRLEGKFLWDTIDLNNIADFDHRAELLVSDESVEMPSLRIDSAISVYRFVDGQFISVWAGTGAFAMCSGTVSAGNRENQGVSYGFIEAVRAQADILNGPEFLVYEPTGEMRVIGMSLSSEILQKGYAPAVPGPVVATFTLGNANGRSKYVVIETAIDEGYLGIYKFFAVGGFQRMSRFFASDFRGGNPVVADLDGKGNPYIIAKRNPSTMVALRYSKDKLGFAVRWIRASSIDPVIDDLDGDGKKEVITAVASATGGSSLIAYNFDGSIKWRRDFNSFPVPSSNRGIFQVATGQFDGAGGRDVYVALSMDGRSVSSAVVTTNGDSTQLLWSTEPNSIGPYRSHVSIRDYNLDGKDDLFIVTNNLFAIYDGSTGKPLTTVVDFRKLGLDFYANPIIIDSGPAVLMSAPSSLASTTLSASAVYWSLKFPEARPYPDLLPGVGDVDGDARNGRLEIGGTFASSFNCYTIGGDLKWQYQGKGKIQFTDVITADIDGDGKAEFIYGAENGRIYVLKGDVGLTDAQREKWVINVGMLMGNPIVADVDGDGSPEIIVTRGDATLLVLKQ